jgi:hypothetical protein
MGKSRNRTRILATGMAAFVGLGSPAPAHADLIDDTTVQQPPPTPESRVVKVRWRGVRVPPGILTGVPSGAIPGGARLVTYYPPYPVGFSADPYFTPPATITVPPPIVFAPPPFVYGGPPVGLPLYGGPPVGVPFYGGCFVQSDFAGQHGHYGSCGEALYRQWTSRPY